MWLVPMTGSPPMPTAEEKPMSRSSCISWYVSVPDLETSPIRPGAGAMSAGMIPALDCPGLIRPGQLGPMTRVPRAFAYAVKATASWTGTPSVMTTASPMPASTASVTAAPANAGGTKTTVASAPVACDGFAYGAEDGHGAVVEVDAAARLARVDAADDVGAGGEHPAGVLHALASGHALHEDLAVLGEIDGHVRSPHTAVTSVARTAARRAAASIVVACWTSGWARASRMARPRAALLPSRRTTRGLVSRTVSRAVTMPSATESQAVMPPKTLTRTLTDSGVVEDGGQGVGHDLGGCPSADVEEVRGPGAAARDDVEGGHDQSGAVADDADFAVEA